MQYIQMKKVSFTYGNGSDPVLGNVTLSVNQGEVLSLLGPNGSGKTTLLKILLGFRPPASGEILLKGRSVSDMRPEEMAGCIAYVPQLHRLTFAYSVMDVVLMGRISRKNFFFRYSKEDRTVALQALEQLSIDHLKDRAYTEISGGERQLTLIARALVQGAKTFVLDEPVNGLDYGNQIRLLKQIAALAEEGYTFIQTSHFPDHAIWISDRVVMLQSGKVIAHGRVSDVMTNVNLERLYNTPIKILDAGDGMRVCVPGALRKKRPSLLCAA